MGWIFVSELHREPSVEGSGLIRRLSIGRRVTSIVGYRGREPVLWEC